MHAMTLRVGALGDLHLGCNVEGLPPAQRLADQEDALNRAFDLFIAEGCDLVVNAGDTWHRQAPTPEEYVAFTRPLRRLREAGIPLLTVTGNGVHDGALRTVTAPEVLADLQGFRVSRYPEVVSYGDVYVSTLPWKHVGWFAANHADEEGRDWTNALMADQLVEIARGLRARIPADTVSLLLGHWSLTGARLPTGLPVDALREPVISWPELEALGFDAYVFSHIHPPAVYLSGSANAQTVVRSDEGVPPLLNARGIYTSSLLPVDFGEAGHEHGVWTLEFDGASCPATRFHPVGSRPLRGFSVDLTGEAEPMDALLEAVGAC
jgi:DNA repair exonuclease SbcCD nuclease subunit